MKLAKDKVRTKVTWQKRPDLHSIGPIDNKIVTTPKGGNIGSAHVVAKKNLFDISPPEIFGLEVNFGICNFSVTHGALG